ncbi:uncharacterized protein J3D65DRAFT_13696 [Phyllosticta citribraziliensis]|uniref:Uncharacterized protein n=1 Tax=Phyllosticta citribraziliensis TaxID=989973 RepID=A0ABR1M8V7_9PEZI
MARMTHASKQALEGKEVEMMENDVYIAVAMHAYRTLLRSAPVQGTPRLSSVFSLAVAVVGLCLFIISLPNSQSPRSFSPLLLLPFGALTFLVVVAFQNRRLSSFDDDDCRQKTGKRRDERWTVKETRNERERRGKCPNTWKDLKGKTSGAALVSFLSNGRWSRLRRSLPHA